MQSVNLPSISIVTTSFNHGRYIEANILSVLNQSYANYEHIIIDAGSKDETIEILKKYSHLKWVSEPDNGQSDGLNKGFLKANGDWIIWLNSDDYLSHDALEQYSKAIQKNPCCDLFYGHTIFVDANGSKLRDLIAVPFQYEYLIHDIFMPPSSGTMFRSSLLKNKLLDVNYHYAMDTEWYLRCGKLLKSKLINRPLVYFRFWDNKTSNLYLGRELTIQQMKERDSNIIRYQQAFKNNYTNISKLSYFVNHCYVIKSKYYIIKSFYFVFSKIFNYLNKLP